MANGTRGGSTDTSLPLIASDDITAGPFNGQTAQIVKLGVGADNALDLIDSAHPLPISSPRGLGGGIVQKVTTLTTAGTAYAVPTSALAFRATLLVQAVATNTDPVWLGGSGVTADAGVAGGIRLMPGETLSLDLASIALFAISTAPNQLVATLEIAFQ